MQSRINECRRKRQELTQRRKVAKVAKVVARSCSTNFMTIHHTMDIFFDKPSFELLLLNA